MDPREHRWNTSNYYRRMAREEPSFGRNMRSSPKRRTISFELTPLQSFAIIVVFFLSFAWIFCLGVTVGKQFPEDKEKLSLLQKIALVMGYNSGKKTSTEAKSDQDKVPSPGEMQLSLTYHKELSRPAPGLTSRPVSTSKPSSTSQPAGTTKNQPTKETSNLNVPPPPSKEEKKEEKEHPKLEDMTPTPTTTIESTGEKYTVLVASFKSPENAGRLEQMLRTKGYMVSRQETLIKNETWYRVMVGNFDNREAAVRFMAMFNEKEGLKGVVVRK